MSKRDRAFLRGRVVAAQDRGTAGLPLHLPEPAQGLELPAPVETEAGHDLLPPAARGEGCVRRKHDEARPVPDQHRRLSIGVAAAMSISMYRAITGVSILWFIVPGYLLSLALSFLVPATFTAIVSALYGTKLGIPGGSAVIGAVVVILSIVSFFWIKN